MEQNNKGCKIVQDLLPIYAENLAHDETNTFVQDHIMQCGICAEKLRNLDNFSDETIIEDFNQDEEIRYLKNIRRKMKLQIIISTMIIITVTWFVCKVILDFII